MSELQVTILMKTITCHCGMIYAVPTWVTGYFCPRWARETIWERGQEVDRLRSLTSRLRGVITRVKKTKVRR